MDFKEVFARCDVLHNLSQFLQFKKREKHPWKNATFICRLKAYNFTKSGTPPWVFFTFLDWTNGYQIARRIANKMIPDDLTKAIETET